MNLTVAEIDAIRQHAMQVGYLVLAEKTADIMLALIGDLPPTVQVITLVDYSQP